MITKLEDLKEIPTLRELEHSFYLSWAVRELPFRNIGTGKV